MRRLPIRIRLTLAFTAVMTLVLLAVGYATLTHFARALDASLDETLTDRAADLVTLAATTPSRTLPGGQDAAEQILTPTGQILAATPGLPDQPLLTATELRKAASTMVRLERDQPSRARLLARPAGGSGGPVIVVAASLADRDAALANLRRELLMGFPIVLLTAATGAYLLSRAALHPVEAMRARAAAISAHTPGQRLPLPAARDEIAALGRTFNALLARLEAALVRERDFVADASHELRTPLALLTTEIELALRRPRSAPELEAALRSVSEETERLVHLAEDLLLLTRTEAGPQPADQPVALAPVLDGLAARYRALTPGRPLTVSCPEGLVVCGDPHRLERAVANLIDNALRHGAGPLAVSATASAGSIDLVVRDQGPGFPPQFLPRAFDRFSCADPARTGSGTGLGLAIVAAIAGSHGGSAHARNLPDGGAEIRLSLPAGPPSAPEPAAQHTRPAHP